MNAVQRFAAAALAAATLASPAPRPAAAAPPVGATPPAGPAPSAGSVWKFDTSVSPCDDFYQYVCGVWIKDNSIPADQPAWSQLIAQLQDNRETLHQILDATSADDPHRSPAERQIGDFYASCLDEKQIEARGTAPLSPDLGRIAALQSKRELAPLLARLHRQGTAGFFTLSAAQAYRPPSAVVASIAPGGMGLPGRDYYLKDDPRQAEQRAAYAAHVERMLELLGEPPAEAHADAAGVLAIETALAAASLDAAARRDPAKLDHEMNLQELAALAPDFGWRAYLTALQVSPAGPVNVEEPDFLRAAGRLIAATGLGPLRAYLRWQLVHASVPMLPAAFVTENFGFYGRTLVGMKEMQPRWRRCVAATDRALGDSLGRVFVERSFPPATRARVQAMVAAIESAFEAEVSTLPWMTAATREQALAKLRLIANKVGSPDSWRDASALSIVRGDALGNLQRAQAFDFARKLARIGKPLDRARWDWTPQTVNAFYDPRLNDITLPAGYLQPPAFDPPRDEAYNLGALGITIAHELTHAFDDEGRRYDGHGNLRDWWPPADLAELERRSSCLVDQYSGYTVGGGLKLDGRRTLGENVADNGGARIAFRAFQEIYKNREPLLIDGLTPEQRFFVGRAQFSCENRTPQFDSMLAHIDSHAPNRYRINGAYANMSEFQRAFGCKDGAPMALKNACRIW